MTSITYDFDSVINNLEVVAKKAEAAAVMAVNAATELGRLDATNYISSRYELPTGYVKTRLKITEYATQKKPRTIISARARSTKLNEFSHRQKYKRGKTVNKKNAGVEVKVKKSGSAYHWGDAFFINLKSGNRGLAVRKKGGGRNDIKVLYSVSVGYAFGYVRDNENLAENMLNHAKAEFLKYLEK